MKEANEHSTVLFTRKVSFFGQFHSHNRRPQAETRIKKIEPYFHQHVSSTRHQCQNEDCNSNPKWQHCIVLHRVSVRNCCNSLPQNSEAGIGIRPIMGRELVWVSIFHLLIFTPLQRFTPVRTHSSTTDTFLYDRRIPLRYCVLSIHPFP